MRAAVYTRYGGPEVVNVVDVPEPVPKAGEIRIRVRAASVSAADFRVRSLNMPGGFSCIAPLVFGVGAPRNQILGADLAGEVESLGAGVKKFKLGDRVMALTGMGFGGHAELRCLPESGAVALIPADLPFDVAAAIPFGGTTALHYLRDLAHLRAGESIMIVGASGAVGSAAVQLARHFGAEVTAICSARNFALVGSLGAAHAIDYQTEDPFSGSKRFDVVFDATGTVTITKGRLVLKDGGRLLLAVASLQQILVAPLFSMGSKKVRLGSAPERAEHLETLAEFARNGVFKPLIEATFPLSRISEAHALVDTGRKRGSVIVSI